MTLLNDHVTAQKKKINKKITIMIRINQDKGYDLKLTLAIFEEKVCEKNRQ